MYLCDYYAFYKLYQCNSTEWSNRATLIRLTVIGHGTGWGRALPCCFYMYTNGTRSLTGDADAKNEINLFTDSDNNVYLQTPEFSNVYVEFLTAPKSKDVIYMERCSVDTSILNKI